MKHPTFPPFFMDTALYGLFLTSRLLGIRFQNFALAKGLNRTKGAILAHVAHNEGGVTATDLRRCLHLSAATLSKALAEMEADGFITRTPNPDDARSMLIYLAPEGQKLLDHFPEAIKEIDSIAFAGFTSDDHAQLRDLLQRIRTNLGTEDALDTAPDTHFAGPFPEDHTKEY